jgi:protocatechuate 3,4-dioxygenase, beta subunit
MSNRSPVPRRSVLGLALASGVTLITAPLRSLAQQVVRRTPSQILGPFYPVAKPVDQDADLTMIAGRTGRAQGQVIYVAGRVVNRYGQPVPGAKMEVWQANSHGRYTHPSDDHDSPLDPNFEGYAQLVTDAEGRYRIKTIKPGDYPDDASGARRAPHIHFDVTGRKNRLVTQMYFEGETLNDSDRFLATAGKNRGRLIVALSPLPDDKDSASIANWDIVLHDG